MKKLLLALIGVFTLGSITSAQAWYVQNVPHYGSETVIVTAPAFFKPTIRTHTNFWGETVVVVAQNPKQMALEGGVAALCLSAMLGVSGMIDLFGKADPIGLLELTGATFAGALGYIALKSAFKPEPAK
jgi:hypothetical protein